MEEGFVKVLTAVLRQVKISHVHQLQDSERKENERREGEEGRGGGEREKREMGEMGRGTCTCTPAVHPWSRYGQH